MTKQVSRSVEKSVKEKPRCGLCGKTRNLTKTECCGNWICDDYDKYVLFPMPRTVADEIMTATRYAATTLTKGIPGTGKRAKNAAMTLKLKCMFIMSQTSLTSRNLKTHPNSSQPAARNARKSSTWATMDIPCTWESITAGTVLT